MPTDRELALTLLYAGGDPQVQRCPSCGRMWVVLNGNKFRTPARVIGETHFKWAPKSWVMCYATPVPVDHPVAMAAYLVGGGAAVEALNEANRPAQE